MTQVSAREWDVAQPEIAHDGGASSPGLPRVSAKGAEGRANDADGPGI